MDKDLDKKKEEGDQNDGENILKPEHQQNQENGINNQVIVVPVADDQTILEIPEEYESHPEAPPTDSNKDTHIDHIHTRPESPSKSIHDPISQNIPHSPTNNLNEIFVHSSNDENHQSQQGPVNVEITSKRLNVSFFQWFKSLFRHEPQIELLSQAVEEIEESVDQATIIQKLLEIERLKMCLLTENQRVLFNNLGKPSLYSNKKKRKNCRGNTCWKTLCDDASMTPQEANEEIKQKEVQTELDKKVLLLYEKNSLSFDQKKNA